MAGNKAKTKTKTGSGKKKSAKGRRPGAGKVTPQGRSAVRPAKRTGKQAGKTASKPAAKQATKPVTKQAGKTAGKSAGKSAVKVAAKPAAKPAQAAKRAPAKRVSKNAAHSAGGKRRAKAPVSYGPVEAFYAQAIAIEREAAARYREFAQQMTGYGNARTAELFQRLARFESEHAEQLLEKTAGMTLPSIEQLRRGLVAGSRSEVATYEFLYRRVLPHHALLMALAAERRAKAYFERMRSGSADVEIRKLSREFAREEAEHIRWLEQALAVEPQVVHRFDEVADEE